MSIGRRRVVKETNAAGREVYRDLQLDLQKINERQTEAIRLFHFITHAELAHFLTVVAMNPGFADNYFERSPGWRNLEEHKAVSKKLAGWIKKINNDFPLEMKEQLP